MVSIETFILIQAGVVAFGVACVWWGYHKGYEAARSEEVGQRTSEQAGAGA